MYEVCVSLFKIVYYFIISMLIIISFRQICGIYHTRGKKFRKYRTRGFKLEVDKEEYEWWRVRLLIYGFKEACSNISASYLKVGDEPMSAMQFRTMSKGNLTHLSYIFRNPGPIGTEFKTI